jgi:hypothetical protein
MSMCTRCLDRQAETGWHECQRCWELEWKKAQAGEEGSTK